MSLARCSEDPVPQKEEVPDQIWHMCITYHASSQDGKERSSSFQRIMRGGQFSSGFCWLSVTDIPLQEE